MCEMKSPPRLTRFLVEFESIARRILADLAEISWD